MIHTNWNSIWHISSDILFGILSDIYSDILSAWHILRHYIWHSIWHIFWHSGTSFDILSGILSNISSDILCEVWQATLTWQVGNGRILHSHSSQVATAKAMMVSASHVVSVLRGDIHTYVYVYIYNVFYTYIYVHIWLVVSTPLKNTSSSVGMMTFPI